MLETLPHVQQYIINCLFVDNNWWDHKLPYKYINYHVFTGLPDLSIQPTSNDVLEGDSVELSCMVHSTRTTNMTYNWYFTQRHNDNEQEISDEHSPKLTVTSASYIHAGVYRCEVIINSVVADATTEMFVSCK